MKLSNENINKTSQEIQEFLKKTGISKQDRIKLSLIIEESLLRCKEHFGEDHDFKISMSEWFGAPKVKIRIKGKPFNPIEEIETDEDAIFSPEIMQRLMHYETAGIKYRYEDGYNELSSFSTKKHKEVKIPGGSVTVAILTALLCAFSVRFLPQDIELFLVNGIASPVFDTLMSLIVAVNIPVVFFSIISSVCAMEDITTFNTVGSKVISRFFILMFAIAAVTMIVCEVFFNAISFDVDASFAFEEIRNLFLSIFPSNLTRPFVEGNILQIVIIALLISACVVFLGDRVKNLKYVIIELNSVILRMMELVLKLLPIAIFLIVFKTVLSTTVENIVSIWKIIVASYLTYLVFIMVLLVRLVLKYKISVKDFLQKISHTLVVSFVTGSGTAAMATNFEVCKKNLNINEKFCDFWIPLSHSLFSPGTVISMVVYAFFSAAYLDVDISIVQLIIIAFLAVQLSICSPKVNGGNIAILTMLLTQLGFSLEVLGTLIIADGFINNVSGVFGMLARNCEIFDISHEVKF